MTVRFGLPPNPDRCGKLFDGCRCLRTEGHAGPCDPSLTPWADVQRERRARLLRERADGALLAAPRHPERLAGQEDHQHAGCGERNSVRPKGQRADDKPREADKRRNEVAVAHLPEPTAQPTGAPR